MDNNCLAELLYPNITLLPADIEARYPKRDLPEGAKVTRIPPSPTGFMHLGNVFGAVWVVRVGVQSGGVFYLRIEDTDSKREVEGGVKKIIDAFRNFELNIDEGATLDGDIGNYGPYRQSERVEIYQTFAKQLVREGKAYPCFCTEEELEKTRSFQEENKLTTGYYGKFAVWRDAEIEKIKEQLDAGKPFVLRFRSEGSIENKYKFTDQIKGVIEITENNIDQVLLKSDGIPTYHFAHVIDDHLMQTTHVVRGEEWLPSLPFHLQLFKALGFKLPKYCHTAQLMKMDGNSKRKLSKRKDPELALDYYHAQGYPVASVREYLMTLLNSNFEEWRQANPTADIDTFPFTTKKMSVSGSLFDLDKLNDVSKNTISRMSAETVYDGYMAWASEFEPDYAADFGADPDYSKRILSIGRGGTKPRKDLAVWADVKPYTSLFFDKTFKVEALFPDNFEINDIRAALAGFAAEYDEHDTQDEWFDKLKAIAAQLGFAPETKLYKKSPQDYKGHVGDISMFIRIAVTGKINSPDMYEVMQILGRERTLNRINAAIATL